MLRIIPIFLCLAVTLPAYAAKEKFERTKPHVNIGTIGQQDCWRQQAPAYSKACQEKLIVAYCKTPQGRGCDRKEVRKMIAAGKIRAKPPASAKPKPPPEPGLPGVTIYLDLNRN